MKMVCPKADTCTFDDTCASRTPHERTDQCEDACGECGPCVPDEVQSLRDALAAKDAEAWKLTQDIEEYYKPIEALYEANLHRAESIVRDEAFDYAADMLRRHADSWTARGQDTRYQSFMQAATFVEGMKHRNTTGEGIHD